MTNRWFGSLDIVGLEDHIVGALDFFDGPLELSWHHCATTSDLISVLCAMRFHLPAQQIKEARHSIAYLSNELIENALKFKSPGDVSIRAAVGGGAFNIQVKNLIDFAAAERFQTTLSDIIGGDPNDLLISKIEINAAQPDSRESGLGLLTLMSDYGAKLAWMFGPVDHLHRVCLETYASLSITGEIR